jgi:hypothetical protein
MTQQPFLTVLGEFQLSSAISNSRNSFLRPTTRFRLFSSIKSCSHSPPHIYNKLHGFPTVLGCSDPFSKILVHFHRITRVFSHIWQSGLVFHHYRAFSTLGTCFRHITAIPDYYLQQLPSSVTSTSFRAPAPVFIHKLVFSTVQSTRTHSRTIAPALNSQHTFYINNSRFQLLAPDFDHFNPFPSLSHHARSLSRKKSTSTRQ